MGKGLIVKFIGVALALITSVAPVRAQVLLPQIDVNWTRLNSGMVGTSNSIITAEDIARSPAQNLPDILSREVGVQVQHLLSSTNGSRDGVDLRGFGAFAQSNVLILVNGRRQQDFDLQGFDFSSIPLNSIERIEITRGNSSTVLYGDGAIGGSINIVLKKGSSPKRVQPRRGPRRFVRILGRPRIGRRDKRSLVGWRVRQCYRFRRLSRQQRAAPAQCERDAELLNAESGRLFYRRR